MGNISAEHLRLAAACNAGFRITSKLENDLHAECPWPSSLSEQLWVVLLEPRMHGLMQFDGKLDQFTSICTIFSWAKSSSYLPKNEETEIFTSEQMKTILDTATPEMIPFIALVQQYLKQTLEEAAAIAGSAETFRPAYDALTAAAVKLLKSLPKDSPLRELINGRNDAACFQGLDDLAARIPKKPCEPKLAELNGLVTNCRDLVKDVDLVFKLATRLVDAAESDAGAGDARAEAVPAIEHIEQMCVTMR